MNRQEHIEQKLSALKPHYLHILNESHLHEGHKGHDGSNESHFAIEISAEILNGKKLLQQHRIINDLLKEEFEQGLHALSIKIR